MSSRRERDINLPAPYLRRLWLDPSRVPDREAYPFCLPFLHHDFSISLDRAITIIVGENGTGKSTLLEGIAVLAGFDEAGGGKGFMSPSRQIEFLKLMRMMDKSGHCQIIMATHSPVLMAYPNATLLRLAKYGLEPTTVQETDHYKTLREFFEDPMGFVAAAIEE